MEIINKHYEKIILVVCLVLMVMGLLKVGNLVREANEDLDKDIRTNARTINEAKGNMVADFDPTLFKGREPWIERIKTGKPMNVIQISEVVAQSVKNQEQDASQLKQDASQLKQDRQGKTPETCDTGEAIIRNWDRRYFNILTRHSRKPIEEAEAKYRVEKNQREWQIHRDNVKRCQEAIAKRIKEVGEREDDTRLAELKLQMDGYQKLLANTEMDILELKKRVRYISMFCSPQGSLVDPQEIVCCPNPDCGSLMLSQADTCPFCGHDMPAVNPAEAEGKDSDGDGLPDQFERAHRQKMAFLNPEVRTEMGMGTSPQNAQDGRKAEDETMARARALDPFNPNDAAEDFDGDSFTNFEEYRFGTDIDDPEDYPQPATFIRLISFNQDKFPVRLMGINEGRAPEAQKAQRWRAQFSFMRNYRYVSSPGRMGAREYWVTNEDMWEQVRIGKKFEAPDGKSYVVDDLGYEEAQGQKRAFVKLTEFIPPVRGRRRTLQRENENKEAEKRTPATYTLYERQDGFYETWYAHLIYLPSRAYGDLPAIYNNAYRLDAGAKSYLVQTRFKLAEGETITVRVPVKVNSKPEEKSVKQNEGRSRLLQFGRQDLQNPREESRQQWVASPTVTFKEFQYKITKFDREKKTLSLTFTEGKENKTITVIRFQENEEFTMPDKVTYPLFYQGGETRSNRNERN